MSDSDSTMDAPLNLSLKSREFSPHVLEHNNFQNFQAGYKVYSAISTSPVPNLGTAASLDFGGLLDDVPVVLQVPHVWSHNATTFPERNFLSSPTSEGSALAECVLGQVQLTQMKHRGPKHPVPEDMKDERYFKRRRRNNDAAKRSRSARKERQDSAMQRLKISEMENRLLLEQQISLIAERNTLLCLVEMRHHGDQGTSSSAHVHFSSSHHVWDGEEATADAAAAPAMYAVRRGESSVNYG